MDLSIFTCKCAQGAICPLCKALTVIAIAFIGGVAGYFIAKRKK